MTRPHTLEVNVEGRYQRLVRFDAVNFQERGKVQQAVELLAKIDPEVFFRISDPRGDTLLNYTARTGWTEPRKERS